MCVLKGVHSSAFELECRQHMNASLICCIHGSNKEVSLVLASCIAAKTSDMACCCFVTVPRSLFGLLP